MNQIPDQKHHKQSNPQSKTFQQLSLQIQKLDNLVKEKINSKILKKEIKSTSQPQISQKQNIEIKHQLQNAGLTQDQIKIANIRSNIIGLNSKYISPFDIQIEAVYIDHTATNRPYRPIQDMIQYSKKYQANPHTQYSFYGSNYQFNVYLEYSTQMMHYARDSLLKSFSAPQNQYTVLPAGSGCTGAIQKAIKMLKAIQNSDKIHPHVFITSYQHHSNILPWVQFYKDVHILAHNQCQDILLDKIEQQIINCQKQKIIVSISAASNVTSELTSLKDLNKVIKKIRRQHQKNILFCVDCAAFCCHHELNLIQLDQIDFAFISPHKNLGGVQTCGILLVRKSIFDYTKPTFPGGGTVRFVSGYSQKEILYSVDIFDRQIAGTPPFLGFYRSALSFQLLHQIGYDYIHKRQKRNTFLFVQLINKANEKLKKAGSDTKITNYGCQDYNHRANVLSLNFQYGNKFVFHNFASLLLSDIFGIQVRSGCFCAGPFGTVLLNLEKSVLDHIQDQVRLGVQKFKPGFLRLDLTFYLEQFQVEYIANAFQLIAFNWRNMQEIYSIKFDGSVEMIHIEKVQHKHHFSLKQNEKAKEVIRNNIQQNNARLKQRQNILKKQLLQGKQILQNPIEFVKKKMSSN